MKILVTGGAGFIGSHLIDRLIESGDEVICVDNFFSGSRNNIKHHLSNSRFKLIHHDVTQPLKVKFEKLDRIYNLACPASPVHYQFDPVKTLNTSVLGTQMMLNLARKTGARFLQASTSEVYGDPLKHPQDESYWGNVDPFGERACYDEGKRSAETLCKDFNLQYGVDTRIARIFNVYGPRMVFNDGRVVSNFVLQALLGEDLTIHGDGRQTRSFCYVDDFLDALIAWMENDQADHFPVNIGNPDERTIESIAHLVKQQTASGSKIVYLPYETVPGRMGDVKQRQANIAKLLKFVNWAPKINFEEGLKRTIADFRARLEHRPHIAVFIPSFLPYKGPAEEAVEQITEKLPGWEFDIFTSRQSARLPETETIGRMNIYRLGGGGKLDKFFLPWLAFRKAKKLHQKFDYNIAWGIMASYGSFAALLFRLFTKRVAFIISVFEGGLKHQRSRIFSPVYKLIFKKAHRWQLITPLNEAQRAWLEDQRNVQIVNFDKDWEALAKRTKELFQEGEILSTRL